MDDSLEALLEKATNPKNRYEDWEFIMAFCDKVNAEVEGPQVALRIIVPKIQNENEKVALLALALLEACVKNCGRKFHQELGKFRFLNELIRMISPKYLGDTISEQVQTKIKQLLYSWKVGLPNEPKIAEAYEMLKKQGLIFDESAPRDPTLEVTPPKAKVSLKEDPRQSEMLGKLIKSKNPEDLRAANRLIREMVRRDEKRMEKLKKRLDDLELINNNVKLLNEMLSHYKPDAAEHEKQIIEELHSSVEKMRPQLFRMASELQQNEEGMTEILQANDALIRVLDLYKRTVGTTSSPKPSQDEEKSSTQPNNEPVNDTSTQSGTNDFLLDLADLNFGNPPTPPTSLQNTVNSGSGINLLDDLGLGLPVLPAMNTSSMNNTSFSAILPTLPPMDITSVTLTTTPTSSGLFETSQTESTGFDLLGDLNLLSLSPTPTLNMPGPGPTPTSLPVLDPVPPSMQPKKDPLDVLDTLNIPIESIKPGNNASIQVLNKGGITVSLYFTQNNPAPDVVVMVISSINMNPFPITNFLIQAAAPKVMRVKLQPPTNTELLAFNPLTPPASVSQIILLANPSKAPIRLKFRISYIPQGGTEVVELAEASDFPSF